ncbi:hypothetical protein [Bacteroides oleiciplenus]|uniref:Uncharacterized protein n=1 Tax=Bacteroides oleiciplenus TaxID=626931 RepID=A0A3E5B975_9BACE|nr:hypothetical protein [Bacteroides oleiciplenus]RGN33875.1 hypothetical protein DXB65_15470 [Bacteroides oleiciplenus]
MGYIKFVLSTRKTDADGNATTAVISRIESDMADTGMLETNLIMHALSARGGKVIETLEFILNSSRLDNDILG